MDALIIRLALALRSRIVLAFAGGGSVTGWPPNGSRPPLDDAPAAPGRNGL